MLDNARYHSKENIYAYAKLYRVVVLFLPPYSPDWNPIELMWAGIKQFLRKYCNRVKDASDYFIHEAIEYVNENRNHIKLMQHCSYVFDKDTSRIMQGIGFREEECNISL